MRTIGLAFAVTVALAAPAHADTMLFVGGSAAGCDFSSIEAAIAAAPTAGLTSILLANDRSYQNVHLANTGKSIALLGGHDDCLTARRSASESGMIGDIRTVISAEAAFQGADVRLGAIDLRLGGPITINGPLTLTLERSTVRAGGGAGAELMCRDATVLLRESILRLRTLLPGSNCALVGDGGGR